jgi:excisionase family DNA binding protein
MRAEAAEKAKKELPETVSTNDLARYFGVSRSKVWTMATRGELRVIRRGQSFLFPRAEIVDYIRSRGAPHGKKPFYGSAGIVEYRK